MSVFIYKASIGEDFRRTIQDVWGDLLVIKSALHPIEQQSQ